MTQRYELLDLLRFFAAFFVVTYHYYYFATNSIIFYKPDNFYKSLIDPMFTYGYLGVQIFFVISGFIILHSSIGKELGGFIKSRIIRLWPALAIGSTLAYAIFLALGVVGHLPNISQSNFILNFFGIPITPLRPIFSSHIITSLLGFNSNLEYIDGAMWTLSREVGFYILIMLLIFAKHLKYIHLYAFVWLLSSLGFFLFSAQSPNYYIHGLSLYLQMDYASYFTLGIFSYLYFIDKDTLTKNHNIFDSIVIKSGLLISFLLSTYSVYDLANVFNINKSNIANPLIAAIIFCILYILFLYSIIIKKTFKENTIKIFGILGGSSYTLYLIHQFNVYRIINYVNTIYMPWGYIDMTLTLIIVIYIIINIHVYLERPLIKITKSVLNKFKY